MAVLSDIYADNELEELKQLQKEIDQRKNKLPAWLSVDDKGNKHISISKLGQEIIKEHPFIITPELITGAYFNGSYWEKLIGMTDLKLRVSNLVIEKLYKHILYKKRNNY